MKRLIAVMYAIRKDIVFLYKTLIGKDTELFTRAVLIGMIIYLLSPLDIIPDALPIIGQLDDIAIILFGVNWVKKSVDSQKRKSQHKEKEVIDSKDINQKTKSNNSL